jgi:two-component system response regulator AtoC
MRRIFSGRPGATLSRGDWHAAGEIGTMNGVRWKEEAVVSVEDASTVESAEPGSARLELVVLEAHGLSIRALPETGAVSIGRGESSEIRLSDPLASRNHATLRLNPLSIEDHASANGTSLGPRRVNAGEPQRVAPGDSITIGDTVLFVRCARGEKRTPMAAAPHASVAVPSSTRPQVVIAPVMTRLYEVVERLARGTINVLVLGETGAGKEMVASALHRSSPRADAPFLPVNCAALSEHLLESELFGHERGAFTGAVSAKPGLLELADRGTVFLDEVGELPVLLQAKLLRVIEAREVTRVGGVKSRTADVRFIAATNRDLDAAAASGSFRADLMFRLSGATLVVPPLRERPSEILPLALGFLERATANSKPAERPRLSAAAKESLLAYHWPGNVRELKNAVERAALLCCGAEIAPEDLALGELASRRLSARIESTILPSPGDGEDAGERSRIVAALREHGGNQTRAARALGIPRRTLVRRIAQLHLPRPRDNGKR